MTSSSSSAKTASAPDSFFTATLAEADPEIAAAIKGELGRQRHEIELIASENIVSRAVLEAQGSVMTNKYAEGYPGTRYYGGCEWVDVAETLAIERAKKLFGAQFANVQPNSGSQMNQAVFLALLQPGDTFMGLDLAAGGHLTHGSPVNMSGKWFKASHYTVRREDQIIDMDEVAQAGRAGEAEADHRRRLGLFARLGLQALPRDRRQRRRLSAGRHGAFRRPRRRRRPCLAGAACACHHHDHAQVAARPARRPDPLQRRGDRQEAELGDLPGPAGRSADARDRRQGGGVRRGAAAGLQDLCEERGRERQGAGGNAARPRLRHRLRRHRQPSDAGRPPAEGPEGQRVGEGAGARRDHLQQERHSRSIPKSRSSPRAFVSARRRRPRAASASPNSSRSAA